LKKDGGKNKEKKGNSLVSLTFTGCDEVKEMKLITIKIIK